MKMNFWKKFSKYLLLGFSLGVLIFAAQNTYLLNLSQNGVKTVLADQDQCATDPNQLGCDNAGTGEGSWVPDQTPASVTQPAAPACSLSNTDYPQCGGDCSNGSFASNHSIMVHRSVTNSCTYNYACDDLGVRVGECGNTAPQPPFREVPVQTAPTSAPIITTQAPACNTLINTTTCGQPSYDTCTPHTQADGQIRYDCVASQNHLCVGSLFCGSTPTVTVTPTTPTSLPSCSSLVTQTICGQPTYDTCSFNSNRSVSDCFASANPNCHSGPISCNVAVRPVTPVVPVTPVGGPNTNTNTNTVTVNPPGATIIREVPIIQTQPIAIQVSSVECPANTTKNVQDNKIVCIQNTPVVYQNVGVGTQTVYAKELPKTGLPALAWTAMGLIPAGLRLRRFSKVKKDLENDPNFIFEEREFKSQP